MEQKEHEKNILYIKAEQNVVIRKQQVVLSDLLNLYCSNDRIIRQLRDYSVMTINQNKNEKYVISILKIIELIHQRIPDILVVNEGETDIVIEYLPSKKPKKWLEIVKTVFVGIAVFCGSAFTIMTFNEDVSVKNVLSFFTKLVSGAGENGELVLQIAYSAGLPIGIILFFNHFTKFKIDNDPTPLQVQLRLYENDENKAIIDNASREGRTIDFESQGEKK